MAEPENVSETYRLPPPLSTWLRLHEIRDAEALAGELFRHCFKQPVPDHPRHYIASADILGIERTIAYAHFTPLRNLYLCGGLCIDDRAYRRLPAESRSALKAAGGIAEQLLRHSFHDLRDADAIFGYVGDIRAERIDLRVGFRHTGFPHLIVYWPKPLSIWRKFRMVLEVQKLGPF